MKNVENCYLILNKTIPAVRTNNGDIFFFWNDTKIVLNSSGIRMLNLLDGKISIYEIIEINNWDKAETLDLINRFIQLGIIKYSNQPNVQNRKGWIKTTKISAISIEIVQKCNQNCVRCYLKGLKTNEEQLTLLELSDLFTDLSIYGITSVCLSGGEPFMHENIFEIIEMAKNKSFQVLIATNGTLLTDKTLQKLKSADVDGLQISVDGLKETHDFTRQQPGAFESLKQVFNKCYDFGIPAYAFTNVNNYNINELTTLNEILFAWKATGHVINRYIPSGVAIDNFELINRSDLIKEFEKLKNNVKTPIISCDPVINLLLDRSHICGAGYYASCITADGFVKLCDTLPIFIGNIRENNFGFIIENSKLINDIILKNQNSENFLEKPEYGCLACQYLLRGNIKDQDICHPKAVIKDQISIKANSINGESVPFIKQKNQKIITNLKSIKIREFKKEDIDNLVLILKANGQYNFPDIEGPDAMLRVANCDAAIFLIAQIDDKAIGFIKAIYDGSRALIHVLSIHPKYQKRGIGTMLVDATINEFKKIGAPTISVTASESSIGFWEKLAFEKLPISLMLRIID